MSWKQVEIKFFCVIFAVLIILTRIRESNSIIYVWTMEEERFPFKNHVKNFLLLFKPLNSHFLIIIKHESIFNCDIALAFKSL